MSDTRPKSKADADWENRTLCADESCIGVVGPDGLCKECGRPYEGFEHQSQTSTDDDVTDDSDPETADPDDLLDPTDWEARTLCADESCIGVVGPDGLCKECGKPYPKKTPAPDSSDS